MALVDNAWYVSFGDGSTTGYFAVTKWAATTTKTTGDVIRQNAAPAVGNERCFVCIASTGGTGQTGAAEPAFTLTRGAKTTDNTVTWQECTGIAGINGDKTNTPTWSIVKNTAVTLGQVIQSVNGNFLLIATTAGTAGNGAEPSWAAYTAAGATTADNTVTWTTLKDSGNNFATWAAPHARLLSSFTATWGQAGNKFYMASDSRETRTTAITLTSPGTLALPVAVISVDKTVAVPPTATTVGGSIEVTAANFVMGTGHSYFDGLTIKGSNSGNNMSFMNTAPVTAFWTNCSLTKTDTGAGGFNFTNVAGDCNVVFDNCTFTFGSSTTQTVTGNQTHSRYIMKGGSFAVGANVPTTLFTSLPAYVLFDGVDLSAFGSGKTLFGAGSANASVQAVCRNCKINASVTIAATPAGTAGRIELINTDSANTNYRFAVYDFAGTLTTETTIVRTGGATDGTTPVSQKIVTTANSSWIRPFESLPLTIWNNTTGANVTVTVYGIWGGGAVPNNDDIWIDVEYLGNSSSQATFANSTKSSFLAAGSALSSDGSTWGGSTTAFKMTVTLSAPQPQNKGPIIIRIRAATASTTFYIDPKPVLS